MICPNCGHHAKDTDKYCVKCATKLVQDAEQIVNEAEAAVENTANEAEATVDAAVDNAVNDFGKFANESVEAVEDTAEAAETAVENEFKAAENAVEAEVKAVEEAVESAVEPPVVEEPAPFVPVVPTVTVKPDPATEHPVLLEEEKPAEFTRLTKPLSTWGFIWRILLFCIPVFCMIPLFVMAFSSGINKNSRSFARAVLILLLILFALAAAAAIYLLVTYGPETISNYLTNLYNAVIGK